MINKSVSKKLSVLLTLLMIFSLLVPVSPAAAATKDHVKKLYVDYAKTMDQFATQAIEADAYYKESGDLDVLYRFDVKEPGERSYAPGEFSSEATLEFTPEEDGRYYIKVYAVSEIDYNKYSEKYFDRGKFKYTKAKTLAITVKEADPVDEEEVTVTATPETATLEIDGTQQITVNATEGAAVTYSSSDDSVATVDAAGLVTAKAAGTAIVTVTATKGEEVATDVVVVTVNAAAVTPVATVGAVEGAYIPTAAPNFTMESILEFKDANGNATVKPADFVYKVYDSAAYFNVDGTLAQAYATTGLSSTGTIIVVITDAAGANLGEFTVDVVSGTAYREITKAQVEVGAVKKDYITLADAAKIAVKEVVTYNDNVIGDEDGETVDALGAGNFASGVDLESSNSAVLVVKDNGDITPITVGTANVTIKWNNKEFVVPVEVKATPAVSSVTFPNGSLFELTTADNARSFDFVVKDQHGADLDTDVTVELVTPETAIDGLSVTVDNTDNQVDVNVNTTLVTQSVTATYKVKAGTTELGTFTVDYKKAGTVASYTLRTSAADKVLDFYTPAGADADTSITLQFIGLDNAGLVAAVYANGSVANKTLETGKYTVTLTGLTEGTEEATLAVAADGTITVQVAANAPAAGKVVTLTVKEGSITRATEAITVKNTTPAAAELTSLELAEGTTAVLLKGDTNFDGLASFFAAKDQYGADFDLGTVNALLYTTDETVFSVNPADREEITVPVGAADAATASVVVSIGNIVKVFPVAIDKTAPEVTGVTDAQVTNADVTPASVATDIKTVALTKDTVAVDGYALGTAVTAEGVYVLTVTDKAGNQTVVNFTIDKTAPAAHATTAIAIVDEGDLALGAGDTVTIMFSENLSAASKTAVAAFFTSGDAFGAAGTRATTDDFTTGDDTLVITLGAGATLAFSDTITITAADVIDAASNTAAVNVVFTVPANF